MMLEWNLWSLLAKFGKVGARQRPSLEVGQIICDSVSIAGLLKYNHSDVEIQVAVVQYQAVIPYLVETVSRRTFRLNQGFHWKPVERKCNGNWYCQVVQ